MAVTRMRSAGAQSKSFTYLRLPVWNCLPRSLLLEFSLLALSASQFRRHLKTFFAGPGTHAVWQRCWFRTGLYVSLKYGTCFLWWRKCFTFVPCNWSSDREGTVAEPRRRPRDFVAYFTMTIVVNIYSCRLPSKCRSGRPYADCRGVHPPKSMMHVAYSPYFHKI